MINGDLEQTLQGDFLERLHRLETICTSDIFMILKKDKKWLDRGWNIDRVYKTIEELRQKIYQELVYLFLKSEDGQRMHLTLYVINHCIH